MGTWCVAARMNDALVANYSSKELVCNTSTLKKSS